MDTFGGFSNINIPTLSSVPGVAGLAANGSVSAIQAHEQVINQAIKLVAFQSEIGARAAELQASSSAINMSVRALQTAATSVRA